jgi:hypothetical protein
MSRRSYITLGAFQNDIFTYTTSIVEFTTVGTLTPIGGSNCPKGRFLFENGRKLFPGTHPGVSTYMIGVYDPVSSLKGFIDPNSKLFSPMNTDKSSTAQITDNTAGTFATNPNGGAERDQGPGVFTLANSQFGGTVDVSGVLNVHNDIQQYGYTHLPKFAVIMWGGAVGDIPIGWILCDGRTVTVNDMSVTAPDLRGRFVLSYGQGPLSFANTTVGTTGGLQTVTLTTNQIPSHSHDQVTVNDDFNNSSTYPNFSTPSYPQYDGAGTKTWTSTIQATGGGQAHENMPPFYTLCFIMKGF